MSAVIVPYSLDELWDALDKNPEAALLAGGTDLLVRLRSLAAKPHCMICMERLDDLKGVRIEGNEIMIGALTTHREMLCDPVVQKEIPIMVCALKNLGSPPVRNMGTLGGNIVTASPAGDTLAPLYNLNAKIELRSKNSSRRLPIESFILGPGRVDLNPGEIVSQVIITLDNRFSVHHYEKVGRRNALSCAIVSMASLLDLAEDNTISEIRLAWGSVGPTVMRLRKIENFLAGRPLTFKGIGEAIGLVQRAVNPIDDIRASADYRREVSGRLLLRLVSYACSR